MGKVILLIHGVESNCSGMISLREQIYNNIAFKSCKVKIHNYGRLPVIFSINDRVKRVYTDYLKEHILRIQYKYQLPIDIIAHSFGTYLLCNALICDELKVNNIIRLEKIFIRLQEIIYKLNYKNVISASYMFPL